VNSQNASSVRDFKDGLYWSSLFLFVLDWGILVAVARMDVPKLAKNGFYSSFMVWECC
jgi:hypothetical protein